MKKWLGHTLFWLLAFLLCLFLMGYKSDWREGVLLTGMYFPVAIAAAYFITNVLIGQYFLTSKYFRFAIYIFYTIIVSFFLIYILNTVLFIFLAKNQYAMMPLATKDIITLFVILYLIIFLFVSTQAIWKWNEANRQTEVALKEKAEAELRFLRTQLHPHFLFNTLNNLYALTIQKSDQAPEMVNRLSNLLDYILHGGSQKLVPVKDELTILDDFIYLESQRYQDRLKLEKEIAVADQNILIPPMLLITLMENCFKHGALHNPDTVFIKFVLRQHNNSIYIHTENSIVRASEKQNGGIGLANIQKQLKHLYNDHYSLETQELDTNFLVSVTLPVYG